VASCAANCVWPAGCVCQTGERGVCSMLHPPAQCAHFARAQWFQTILKSVQDDLVRLQAASSTSAEEGGSAEPSRKSPTGNMTRTASTIKTSTPPSFTFGAVPTKSLPAVPKVPVPSSAGGRRRPRSPPSPPAASPPQQPAAAPAAATQAFPLATPAKRARQRQDARVALWLPRVAPHAAAGTPPTQLRCAALLAEALASDHPDTAEAHTPADLQAMAAAEAEATVHAPAAVAAVAAAVERCVACNYPYLGGLDLSLLGGGPRHTEERRRKVAASFRAYTAHVRSLVFNLKAAGNGALRQRVLTGRLPPAALAAMDTQDLAPPKLAERYAKMRAEASAPVEEQWAEYSRSCPECGSLDTRYALVSTRRDIGKNETWGAKEHSAACIKVRCLQCGNQYTADDIM